ncbi:hypothetical protein F4604DRAFT_1673451 [Suillus subluteus]|nr:hypothetical protein F4604DRAFT_1673451 [Suillus subluteus]
MYQADQMTYRKAKASSLLVAQVILSAFLSLPAISVILQHVARSNSQASALFGAIAPFLRVRPLLKVTNTSWAIYTTITTEPKTSASLLLHREAMPEVQLPPVVQRRCAMPRLPRVVVLTARTHVGTSTYPEQVVHTVSPLGPATSHTEELEKFHPYTVALHPTNFMPLCQQQTVCSGFESHPPHHCRICQHVARLSGSATTLALCVHADLPPLRTVERLRITCCKMGMSCCDNDDNDDNWETYAFGSIHDYYEGSGNMMRTCSSAYAYMRLYALTCWYFPFGMDEGVWGHHDMCHGGSVVLALDHCTDDLLEVVRPSIPYTEWDVFWMMEHGLREFKSARGWVKEVEHKAGCA